MATKATKTTKTTKAKKTAGGADPGPGLVPIFWQCTAGIGWAWRSGDPTNATFPCTQNDSRSGMVYLSPNADYWYPCIELEWINQTPSQGALGYACLRYFPAANGNNVQAMVYCPGNWSPFEGPSDPQMSQTNGDGGFNLTAYCPFGASGQ